jgi:trehalose utilization protein
MSGGGNTTPFGVRKVPRENTEGALAAVVCLPRGYQVTLILWDGQERGGWSGGTAPKDVYPHDINGAVAEGLKPLKGWEIATATITDPDQGVPKPDTVVFDGLYLRPDGSTEESRQGLAFTVGKGKVFYFQPGHETYPHFFDENVRHILRNAVEWAAPAR